MTAKTDHMGILSEHWVYVKPLRISAKLGTIIQVDLKLKEHKLICDQQEAVESYTHCILEDLKSFKGRFALDQVFKLNLG